MPSATWTDPIDWATGRVVTDTDVATYLMNNLTFLKAYVAQAIGPTLKVVSPVANLEFASIPTSYQHLLMFYQVRTTQAVTLDGIRLRFNGDSGGNYDRQHVHGTGTTASAGEGFAATGGIYLHDVPGASAGANLFAAGFVFIPFYTSGQHKPVVAVGGYKIGTTAGTMGIRAMHGQWRSTAAITTVRIYPDTGANWAADTSLSVIGISSP